MKAYDILAAICIMKSSFFQLCAEYSKEVSRCLWTCTFWPGDIYGSRETKNEFIYFYFLAENWQSYIRNAYILGIFESHFWKPHKWFESNSYIENLYGFSKDFPGPIFLELSNGACPLDDSNVFLVSRKQNSIRTRVPLKIPKISKFHKFQFPLMNCYR